jgi:tripartite-type tricarboxylate transporter receptor subunit TctC
VNQRRIVLRSGLAAACAALCGRAYAQAWPTRPIQLFVAFAPGGAGDIVARAVGKEMSRGLGQTVLIENRPAPVVAVQTVAKAKPDGYTLMLAGNGTALSQALFKSLPYDVMKDFVHISTLASFDLTLMTAWQSDFNSVADVLAWARANPGKMNIGTVRIGSTQNLSAEMFKSMTGIDALVVPFKTTADILTALRSKDVHIAFEILPPILTQIAAKNVKVLAVTASKRFPGLPNVPTLAESGVPGFEATSWNGISAPLGTPQPVIDRLAKEIQVAVASPEVQKELQALGFVAKAGTPEQMTQRMKSDIAKWGAVIEKAGIEKQ